MKYDVVIVGAGSAGAVLAARLSEDAACNVALIEAGPDYPDFATLPADVKYLSGDGHHPRNANGGVIDPETRKLTQLHDWQFTGRINAANPAMHVTRGRVTGGSSAVNGAVVLRGTKEDFASWAAIGNTEWSYDKVLPYFIKAETDHDFQNEYHGSSGPMPVMRPPRDSLVDVEMGFEESCVALGYSQWEDHNHPDSTGVGPLPVNTLDGMRMSTARAYLSLARSRPNLTIIPNTLVRRVLFEGTRAIGVEVDGAAGPIIEANEVVLSGGAVKSPHLLMLSGVGPADQLTAFGVPVIANMAGVGQHLRDHPCVAAIWQKNSNSAPDPEDMKHRVGLFLRFTAPGSKLLNDCRIKSPGAATIEGNVAAAEMNTVVFGLLLAESQGEIRLQSADPTTQPLIDYNLLAEKSDRDRMRDVFRIAMDLAHEPAMQKFLGDMYTPTAQDITTSQGIDAWIDSEVRTSHHLTSTCKMGPADDTESVVDQQGRVHGFEGLRVVDASIMPDCVRQNTNLTTIMIGEYIADFMKGVKSA